MSTFGEIPSNEPMENYFLPPGVIMPYGGTSNTAPDGWLFCNGFSHSRTTYANLYSVVGDTYGAGNGSTTFNVPDLRRRFPLGFSDVSATGTAVGQTGGSFDHTHSGPAHTHDLSNHTHNMQNHTHGISHTHDMSHVHNIGGKTVNGYVAITPSYSNQTWYNGPSTNPTRSGPNPLISAYFSVVNSAINGGQNTDGANPSTTGGANPNGSDGPSTNLTGTPSSNTSGTAGTDQTGSANPPYVTLQYIIKV